MRRVLSCTPSGAVSFTALYGLGFGYLLLCSGVFVVSLLQRLSPASPVAPTVAAPRPRAGASAGGAWFAAMKPYCNAVEVETRLSAAPAPRTTDGVGYAAACYALAGKLNHAQQAIDALAEDQRWRAAAVVFNIGHPVADQGDDQSAGPIMRLRPRHLAHKYKALYHARVSEYGLGDPPPRRGPPPAVPALYSAHDSL